MGRVKRTASGRPPTIDRDDVVSAALAILKRQGAASLSMRAVAAELGVSPMAAYHHVRSKEDLIDLAVDEIYRPLTVTDVESDAETRLLVLFQRVRERLREYPGLGLLPFLVHRGDEATRLRNEYRAIAREGGMESSNTYVEAFTLAISLLLTGSSTADSILEGGTQQEFDRSVENSFRLLMSGLRHVQPEESPIDESLNSSIA